MNILIHPDSVINKSISGILNLDLKEDVSTKNNGLYQ